MADIAPLNLNDAADKLRDIIKTSFVELIPKEQWEAMIKVELTKFVTETYRTDYGGRTIAQPSQLSGVCEQVLKEHFKKLFADGLRDPEMQKLYFPKGLDTAAMLKEWLDANYMKIMKDMVGSTLGHVIDQALSNFAMTYELRRP